MNKTIFGTGILLGFTAIALGAFGAHGLKGVLDSNQLSSFETGVRYQMYHALFLLILGSIQALPIRYKKQVFYFITAGVLFFSGSIYLLTTNSHTSVDFSAIGFITPLGGILLILGWLLLGYRVFKQLS